MRWVVIAAFAVLAGCAARPKLDRPPALSVEEIASLFPAKVEDPRGWAADLRQVFDDLQLHPDLSSVCEVLAVVEQESGYDPNPKVPGLGKLVQGRLSAYASKLGPLGAPALEELLKGRAPGERYTFAERVKRLSTERDLDLLFRDLLAFHQAAHPGMFGAAKLASALFGAGDFAEQNPVTTAGSMQVKVRYAEQLAKARGGRPETVREQLYTRYGGLYYGTARLLLDDGGYAEARFRFADYNAGLYSARNAALQEQLAGLTGTRLALDGDFLAYDAQEEPLDRQTQSQAAALAFRARFAPELSEWRVMRDLKLEKERAFEQSDTFRAVKRVWAERQHAEPPPARIPEVTLQSPKLGQSRTTAWFAASVQRRYEACLARAQPRR